MANSKMTQLWFSKAKGDLLAAKYLEQANDESLYVSIAFHCQQCAEKAIKGYLTHNNKRILKTHDMGKLLKILYSINPSFFKTLDSLNDFTRIEATVRVHNERAIKLYTNTGYILEGRRRNAAFIKKKYEDEYYLGKLLI